MDWAWIISQGLIQGSATHYEQEGYLQDWEYGKAIQYAYSAANDAQRKQLIDMLWATGGFQGDQTYWYTARPDEINSLASAATANYTLLQGSPTAAPAPAPGTSPTPADPTTPPSTPGTEPTTPTAPPPGSDPATPPPTDPGPGDSGNEQEGLSRSDLQAIYYWLPAGALSTFIDAYIDKGADAAWAAVRQSPNYETWFPGNMDDNGNIRYPEDQYAGTREAYRDVMRAVGLEPTAIAQLEGKFVDLMEGEVSPNEFMARVESTYNRIVVASDQIKEFYASQYGIQGLSTQDLLFAAMDPEFGRLTFEENFRIAEVGGAAAESGFDISSATAELISERGVNLPAAREMFGRAQYLVPIMDALAQRHNDPDDDFDINEFLGSEVFNDPTQNLRMRRLVAQERSNFAQSGGFTTSNGRITGPTAR